MLVTLAVSVSVVASLSAAVVAETVTSFRRSCCMQKDTSTRGVRLPGCKYLNARAGKGCPSGSGNT